VYCLVIVQLLVSGGVDSTVCAALLHKALCEDQVIALHIDNGFMRKNESQRVEQSLEKLGLRVKGRVWVNVNERVLSSLLQLSYTHCRKNSTDSLRFFKICLVDMLLFQMAFFHL
jgi:GMP synthase PP-ATPase subunit